MTKRTLNANQLKLIAIVAMTIDHLTDVIYPGFPARPVPLALHLIGRLTAPIMWFFVCEGFHYTRSVKKYMLRMFMFSVISHFAYCFAFGIDPVPFRTGIFNQTSVMYPLFIAVVVLWLQHEEKHLNKYLKHIVVFVLIWSAFPANWSCIAVLAIVHMYRRRGDINGQMRAMILWVSLYGLISFFFVSKVYALVLVGVLMVIPLLKMYNGEKGKARWMKTFFYVYYPLHRKRSKSRTSKDPVRACSGSVRGLCHSRSVWVVFVLRFGRPCRLKTGIFPATAADGNIDLPAAS